MNEWTLCINDLRIPMYLGMYPYEQNEERDVIVQVKYRCHTITPNNISGYASIVCYEEIAYNIFNRFKSKRVKFIETLAQGIVDLCFENERIDRVWVKIEKNERVLHTRSVGVEIVREREKVGGI